MKYLCKVSCFRDGVYYKADEVYDMPPDFKPPKSKVYGPMFEAVDPATLQLSQKEEIAALRERVAELEANQAKPKGRPKKEQSEEEKSA